MKLFFPTSRGRKPMLSSLVALMCLFMIAPLYSQKKVVLIDKKNDAYINNSEGYWNGKKKKGDKYEKGKDLEDGMKCVSNGDTLVIIAHGTCTPGGQGQKDTYGMKWGDSTYTGVGGTGGGQMPVPPGFDTLKNVHIICQWCWSDKDPDGNGPCKSMCEQLGDAAGGASKRTTAGGGNGNGNGGNGTGGNGTGGNGNGNTKKGYKVKVISNVGMILRGGCPDSAKIVDKAKNNSGWQNNPPANRDPRANPDQLSALKDLVKGCNLDESCILNLFYFPPKPERSVAPVPIGSTVGQLINAYIQSTTVISTPRPTPVTECGLSELIVMVQDNIAPPPPGLTASALNIYPNPARQLSKVNFVSNIDDEVSIDLYDMMGNKVQHLYKGHVNAGQTYTVEVPMHKLIAGRYFCRMASSKQHMTKHLIKE